MEPQKQRLETIHENFKSTTAVTNPELKRNHHDDDDDDEVPMPVR